MIAELVPFLIAIVAVKLALWAAYSLGVLTTVVVANALFWIRRGLFWLKHWRARPSRAAAARRGAGAARAALRAAS